MKKIHTFTSREGLLLWYFTKGSDFLRHAFATRNLIRWIDEGKDVMALMPYLSTYMGHSELDSTFYYIHLLPDRLLKSAGIDWHQFDGIYGEVSANED